MNKVIMLLILIILTGCSKVPQDYYDAAVRMSEDTCDGVITLAEGHPSYPLVDRARVIQDYHYNYTCVSDNGSVRMKIKYSEIPVKYFKETHNEF